MKIKNKNNLLTIISILVLMFSQVIASQELTGDNILKREDQNRPDSEISVSEMTIVHKSGARRVRKIKVWMKGDDYILVRFLSPANVKGTGFLSVNDNNWLYLPALRKVRRIATKEIGGSFMGSDFSYDDVSGYSWEDDFNTKLIAVEKYKEHDCYILELIPKNPEELSYSRLKRWVDKENFYSVKTEYYDRHGELLKVLYSSEFEKSGGHWVTKRNEMHNVRKGSKTIIIIKEIENPEIPKMIFTTRQLEKR